LVAPFVRNLGPSLHDGAVAAIETPALRSLGGHRGDCGAAWAQVPAIPAPVMSSVRSPGGRRRSRRRTSRRS